MFCHGLCLDDTKVSDSMRRELRPFQISVSLVKPGAVKTEILPKMGGYAESDELGVNSGETFFSISTIGKESLVVSVIGLTGI